MASPVDRALTTYEILENILIHLHDIQEMILAQRVCRTWRSIISDSLALRRATWYAPQADNFLGFKRLRTMIRGEDAFEYRQENHSNRIWVCNPVFERLGFDRPANNTHSIHLPMLRSRICNVSGSWATMLASQPPCRYMIVRLNGR